MSSPAPADDTLEKGHISATQPAGLSFDPLHHHAAHDAHPHLAHARERLRHFIHPDGRRIHVAHSPEEAISLRRRLAEAKAAAEKTSEPEFEIYLSGSTEHLEALRVAHAHHRLRREELRSQEPEAFSRFDRVHRELDALSHELDRVTAHGVTLEAHFSKYGYDARIRSYDEDESPGRSGTTTPRSTRTGSNAGDGSDSASTKQSSVERGYAVPLKLWKRPTVRQYWHKHVLWRASGQQQVQSFELFVDLLYVGILAITGDAAAESPDGRSLLQFVITFLLGWKIWTDLELTIAWFETDDVAQRVSILFQLAVLLGLTTNITHAFEGTYATLIGFYLTARLLIAAYFLSVALLVPMIRPILLCLICFILLGSALWIVSIHLPYPIQLVPIFIAILIDNCSHGMFAIITVAGRRLGPRISAWVDRVFEVAPGTNIEHRTERMNAFVTLVFGYMVVSLLYQTTQNGIDAHFGKAVLGLVQAFCFNWLYFEVDNSNLSRHAIRRSATSTFVWSISHIPFIMSIILAAGALARLVLALDTPGADADLLSPTYADRAETEIAPGIRWFYCAGTGIALASMALISLSHDHREAEDQRLGTTWRMMGRFAVAIVLICLPLATRLDSLELVGTVSALITAVLALELWGASSCKVPLCARDKPCMYVGRCPKQALVRFVRDGLDGRSMHDLLRHGDPDAGAVGTLQ